MGNCNTNDSGGFHESENDGLQECANNMDDAIVYDSQYLMHNSSRSTDFGAFVTNAITQIPKENRVRAMKEVFEYKKQIGEGASCVVLLAKQRFGEENRYSLKQLDRRQEVNSELFAREVFVLKSLQHPNILQFHGAYLDRWNYFIATEYCSGGLFLDRIYQIGIFSEQQALKYIKPILDALRFMHHKGFVHRDLKPSNIVFDKKGKEGTLKLIDFGTSELVMDDELYTAQRIGTVLYSPPEWKRDRVGSHIKKGDLWALGVLVYVLMVGKLPFADWKHIDRYDNDLRFPKEVKKKVSSQCIDFILKLLERYPKKRLSAQEALQHPWIAAAKDDASYTEVWLDSYATILTQMGKTIENCKVDCGSQNCSDLAWF